MSITPKPGDFAVLAIIIAIAVISLTVFAPDTNGSATATIIKNGTVLKKIKLEDVKDRIQIKDHGKYDILITAENGRIRFEEANCPDQVCVKTGWISSPGQSAACVPGGILIKITGESDDMDILLK